ncbi:hypothetical protein KI688_003600 [Linnemannia hyalina]|uniref:Uncharacterized protein n=1 Tax=Linnemannia hyalina TaxID=64524 RepID=A0A9P7XN77_9FUNG|nr:hypothetical protein KI688_003600 [Linnemannia hyalina]
MPEASKCLAQLLAQQAALAADIAKVSERISTHKTQIATFRDSVKTLAEPLCDQADLGRTAVVQDREKLRQGRHAHASKFMEAIQKNLDEDNALLAEFQAEIKEVNALIK